MSLPRSAASLRRLQAAILSGARATAWAETLDTGAIEAPIAKIGNFGVR